MGVYLGNKKVGVTIENIDLVKQIADGTLEEFDNKKVKATTLASQRFYTFKNLKKLNLTGITSIPEKTCTGCTALTELVLDKNTTLIGNQAFSNTSITGDLNFEELCTLSGTEVFYSTNITSVTGKLKNLVSACFRECTQLTKVDLYIEGSIGDNPFNYSYNIVDFKISKDSNITSISSYPFAYVGRNRENPQENPIYIDFRNSTFTSIPRDMFSGTSSKLNEYITLHFPSTVKSISSSYSILPYCSNVNLYFNSITPPTLGTGSFKNITNYKLFVPYNIANTYRTATNWVTYANSIYGYADENMFEQGQALPKYSTQGFELTWYADEELTTQVTSVENPSQYYYCTIGAEQIEVVTITKAIGVDCSISITDGQGNEYVQNSGVPVGTELTITTTTKDGYSKYYATFNGVDFTSPYTYTTISGENIEIIYAYWNGIDVPALPVFKLNSWETIKRVCQEGNASKYWSVGDVKEIEIDGLTYGVRLSDLQSGRYDYASGERKTSAVFEFINVFPTGYAVNTTNTSTGGWAECLLRTTINTTILSMLPTELSSLLEEVVVASADGGTNYTGITTSNNKLFLPSAIEVNSTAGRAGEGTTWDYYINTSSSIRIKTTAGTTSGMPWWLRSPYYYSSTYFVYMGYSGGTTYTDPTRQYYVAPCFAW